MSTTDPQPSGDTPGTADPARRPPAAATDDADTGRHAVQRPAPTPPPARGPGAPVTPAGGGPDPVREPAASPPAPPEAPSASPEAATPPTAPRATSEEDDLFPDPHAPRTPHTGTHALGVLVGLVLAPVAMGLLLFGQSRILVVQADGWDASLELFGIVLVSAGAVLLAALLLLGLWTAAVPITAGLLLGVLGGLQLYAPGIARAATLDVIGADAWYVTITRVTVAGTSGTTLASGVLLLTAGVGIALARRHGVRLGAFRERNRTA